MNPIASPQHALYALVVSLGFFRLIGDAHAQLYISQNNSTSIVGEYDAATGAAINAHFITGLARISRRVEQQGK